MGGRSTELAAAEHEVAGWPEAIDAFFDRGWTDGLPVVPATEDTVRSFLDAGGLAPGHATDPIATTGGLMTIKILDPTVEPEPTESSVAKRVSDLDGKVLGLLANGKVNGDHLLDLVRDELRARYDIRDVVVMTKSSASRVADDAMMEALASQCDVVVTAIGD